MIPFKPIITFLHIWYFVLTHMFKDSLKSRTALEMEILALRSQLALFQQQTLNHKIPKPKPTPAFRRLWVIISKLWPDWKSALLVVKPETVIGLASYRVPLLLGQKIKASRQTGHIPGDYCPDKTYS